MRSPRLRKIERRDEAEQAVRTLWRSCQQRIMRDKGEDDWYDHWQAIEQAYFSALAPRETLTNLTSVPV